MSLREPNKASYDFSESWQKLVNSGDRDLFLKILGDLKPASAKEDQKEEKKRSNCVKKGH